MHMIPYIVVAAGLFIYFHRRMRKVPAPTVHWDLFDQPNARPLELSQLQQLQGIYAVTEGAETFGEYMVIKWSYTVEREAIRHHISFFCGKEGIYFITEAKRLGHRILFGGAWRRVVRPATGTVQLVISRGEGAGALLDGEDPGAITIRGQFGEGSQKPEQALSLRYIAPLSNEPYEVIAHRGGSRNMNFFPVSENSIEMLKLAAPIGATGVEIDVRLTKDGIPVLFHDSFLSAHTLKDTIYAGLVKNYTLQELRQKTLKKGGTVPTLEEALDTLLYQTPIRTIWLDIKFTGDLEPIRRIQQDYLQKAARMQRDLQILIGIPDEGVLKSFRELRDHAEVPSLVELEPDIADEVHANVWAPQYTEGLEEETVARMQAKGRKAFVWSLDDPALIEKYMNEGGFDGIVTNIPSVVAFQYYMTHAAVEQR